MSRYRDAARRAILAALEALPADASQKDRERAATACYPFAERMGWAYDCFLKERRAILGGKKNRTGTVTASPAGVSCPWCKEDRDRCLACLAMRDRWEGLGPLLLAEWAALEVAAKADGEGSASWAALKDWKAENGMEGKA